MLMGLVGGGTVGVVDREEYSVTGAFWFAAVSLYYRYGVKRGRERGRCLLATET
jgi:hypothetical protein